MGTIKQLPKWLWKEYLLPFLILLVITGAGIALFMVVIGWGEPVAPVNQVMGLTTKPTLGRLVYIVAALIGFVVCFLIAGRCARRNKLYPAFYIGFTAGLLLWQAIGEGAWHFGYTEDGTYINFFRLEASDSFFLVVVFAFFTAYLIRYSAPDFGALCAILSFVCDWFGHFLMEGTYPLVSGFMTDSTWYSVVGFTVGIALSTTAVILPIRRYKDLKGHLLCSMMLYIGISVMAFGLME